MLYQNTIINHLAQPIPRRRTRSTSILVASIALVLGFAQASNAQQSWTVEIAGGKVSVNGQVVDPSKVPASLNTRQTIQVQSTGSPVVAFGDLSYIIEPGGLREATGRDIERYGLPSVVVTSNSAFRINASMANRQLVNQLSNLVTELDQTEPATLGTITHDAMRAAQTAAALPHLELQSYWSGLKAEDPALYNDFLRERQLELESWDLSHAIALLPEGEEKSRLESELRSILNESFELKQKNREREIAQLERRLDELRRILDEREKKRDEIVGRRFRELVGTR